MSPEGADDLEVERLEVEVAVLRAENEKLRHKVGLLAEENSVLVLERDEALESLRFAWKVARPFLEDAMRSADEEGLYEEGAEWMNALRQLSEAAGVEWL